MAGLIDPALRSRVARLVPLLASDRDGEVVATVRAMGRTLAAAGSDWHDLAAELRREPSAVSPPNQPSPTVKISKPPEFKALSHHERLAWLDLLRKADDLVTPFEASLVANVWAALLKNPRLFRASPRQRVVIDEAIARAWAHGRRP